MAWLSGYTCRKSISITGSAGAGTLYQVSLTVHSGAGSDAAGVAYLNSNCTDFPNDIRFTDNDGETELDHWCEDTSADPATFWVEVADDLGSNQSIYIYFGKSGASSASSGANTFLTFDDFERGNDGDEVGGSWTEEQGTVEISTSQAYKGTRSMKLEGNAPTTPQASISYTAGTGYAFRFHVYKEDASRIAIRHGNGSYRVLARAHTDEDIDYRPVTWTDTGTDITADTWEYLEFRNFDWTAHTYDIVHEGSVIQSGAGMQSSSDHTDVIDLVGAITTANADTWIDNFIVRKCITTEPSVGTPASMEAIVSAGEGAITPTGALSAIKKFFQNVGQGTITPVGTLARKIMLAVGSGAITPIGTLGRNIFIAVGAGAITPAATLGRKIYLSVGSGVITPAATLGRKIYLSVGSGAVTIAGALNRLIKLSVGGGAITPVGTLIKETWAWLDRNTFAGRVRQTFAGLTRNTFGGRTRQTFSGKDRNSFTGRDREP